MSNYRGTVFLEQEFIDDPPVIQASTSYIKTDGQSLCYTKTMLPCCCKSSTSNAFDHNIHNAIGPLQYGALSTIPVPQS